MLGRLWCRLFHGYRSIAFAGSGSNYRCRRCNRLFLVPWK